MARSQELARLFQQPDSPAQRHYEVCRAYFQETTSAEEIADRFKLHVDTVRAIVRDFARDPDVNSFFAAVGRGARRPRNVMQSTNEPASSVDKEPPWALSAPRSSRRAST